MMEKVKAKMKFKKMLETIEKSREDEFTCDDCFEFMDVYAETIVEKNRSTDEGTNGLVRDHLEKCMDCGEIFETYVLALKKADG